MKTGIGVIGFGRFGKFLVEKLVGAFEVLVHEEKASAQEEIEACGARSVDLGRVCRQEIVILCVPISKLKACLKRVAPLLKPGSLVMDVSSVKVFPVAWMQALLPPEVDILASHPMFGPDSAADSLEGHKIVLCRQRIGDDRYARIKGWMSSRRLDIIETSPEDHDRRIAATLTLTHFVGRSLFAYGAQDALIDTLGYRRLLDVVREVGNDTWQLFEDMNRYNPYAADERQKLIQAAKALDLQLAALEPPNNS